MKVLSLSLEFFNDGAFDEQNFLGEQTTALNYESQKKKKKGGGGCFYLESRLHSIADVQLFI